ncbi:IS110 family transposase [Mariniflexile gromovii]|uniref:IS110 family transposase n=1 Tax=Mariniflexile gromovii TaxID=362523 RepID=A0ABS4BZ70_9FLAO|nr:IS110 family transposase [Mariniflexile gromovii]MBP0905880.1 IS110 family transposase [Mariniflexile gromovii]
MIKNKNYVGIDISKLTFDVAILDEKGKSKHYKFTNDLDGFKKLSQQLNPGSDVCVMEASGVYYLKLATYLFSIKIAVCAINQLVIRRFGQMRVIRTKTDKKDASVIADYGKTETPGLWQPDEDYILELKQMQAYVEQMNKSRTGFIRQREAFKYNPVSAELMNESLQNMIDTLEAQIALIENKMTELVKEHHQNLFGQLNSIPGIGRKTAMLLIVISGGFTKFENAKQLCSYVGISPRIFESGTSVKGRSKICKMGMSRIRAMLYVCSWTAKKNNKACYELYNRLIEKGKSKKLALIAVVNKLLKQAFAVATKNEYYLEIN